MITIHNFAGSAVRGVRVAWQCEEMGLSYRTVGYTYPTPPDYRAKYPPGSVPFLEDGDAALGESVAIMLYLAERYGPTPLLPKAPADLARTLQLTVASETAMGGLMNPLLGTLFGGASEEQQRSWTVGFCEAGVAGAVDYADSLLGDAEFFVGGALTLADIAVATSLFMWAGPLKKPVPPRLAAHRARMAERPAYQRAMVAFNS